MQYWACSASSRHPRRSTLQVKRSSTRPRFEVTVDTRNTVNHAGSAGLVDLADKIGLTKGWSQTMAKTRSRRSAHDPGRVLQDLVCDAGGRRRLGAVIPSVKESYETSRNATVDADYTLPASTGKRRPRHTI